MTNDFSLWRCVIRELAEELRGGTEDYDTHGGPIDYDAWPFAHQLTRALDTAQVHAFCLGIGVDPLTFATDILTAPRDRSLPPCPSPRRPSSGTRAPSPPKRRARVCCAWRGGTARLCSLDHKYRLYSHRLLARRPA
jgi:hypothetical protein